MVTVIDAKGLVLGRMATEVAKRALAGEEVAIVNAEQAVVNGPRDTVLLHYRHKLEVGSSRKGPFFPRMADRIVRRTVRGMVKHQTPTGREAYKRIKAYLGVPREFESIKPVELPKAKAKLTMNQVTVLEISRYLGAKI